ncbi:MerR family transcriptional regulator [Streptomyces sp. NPDC018031]|uniref:MerR family transcriptional regulator n=1 Tax=Streptomyces sp. NPDC018031 TaxID=3365033 RepID=UPI0037B1CBE5
MKSSGPNGTPTGDPAPSTEPSMSIGDLAGHFGLPTHVLRHWEAMGLLAPARDPAGRRRYGAADLTRVAVVLRAKEAGLSLDAIRTLTTTDPTTRRDLLRREAEALRSRIAAARASLALVECALECPHEDFTRCRHSRQVIAERVAGSARRRTDRPIAETLHRSLAECDHYCCEDGDVMGKHKKGRKHRTVNRTPRPVGPARRPTARIPAASAAAAVSETNPVREHRAEKAVTFGADRAPTRKETEGELSHDTSGDAGLGRHANRTWHQLQAVGAAGTTVEELSVAVGYQSRTILKHLKTMAGHGMAEQRGDRWHATGAAPGAAASDGDRFENAAGPRSYVPG